MKAMFGCAVIAAMLLASSAFAQSEPVATPEPEKPAGGDGGNWKPVDGAREPVWEPVGEGSGTWRRANQVAKRRLFVDLGFGSSEASSGLSRGGGRSTDIDWGKSGDGSHSGNSSGSGEGRYGRLGAELYWDWLYLRLSQAGSSFEGRGLVRSALTVDSVAFPVGADLYSKMEVNETQLSIGWAYNLPGNGVITIGVTGVWVDGEIEFISKPATGTIRAKSEFEDRTAGVFARAVIDVGKDWSLMGGMTGGSILEYSFGATYAISNDVEIGLVGDLTTQTVSAFYDTNSFWRWPSLGHAAIAVVVGFAL